MDRFLPAWRYRQRSNLKPGKESDTVFLFGVVAVIVLYLIGFSLLGHTFRLLWLSYSKSHLVHWSGWNNTEFIFAFGDSYTTTSFDINGAQPDSGNPLGNANIGWLYGTQVNTSNYIQYLTLKYNESLILTYNFGWAGGTTDNRIDESPFGSLSFNEQVEREFVPHFGNEQKYRSWNANNSLFTIFFGINDVLMFKSEPNASDYASLVAQSYETSTERLYENGARNFLFINVPAVDRSPGAVKNSDTAEERIAIKALNTALQKLAKALVARHRDATAFFLDSYKLTTTVLDDPKAYPITSMIKNTTQYCSPYERSPELDLFDPSCGIPRNEYFWADHLHPTSTIHDLIANRIVKTALRKPL